MAANTSLQATRAAVKRRLPKLMRKAMADYAAFAAQPAPDDAKGFAGHQAACKAALAHLDAGAKLLVWAEGPSTSTGDADDLARMIQAAEDAVAAADPDSI
tara:strand:+ start:4207 stop:4509 length:303 start_codon:yes stop_codon:yes gene_type:complete